MSGDQHILLFFLLASLFLPLCIGGGQISSSDHYLKISADKRPYMPGDTISYSVLVQTHIREGELINVSLVSDSYMCSGGCRTVLAYNEHMLSGDAGQNIRGELKIPPLPSDQSYAYYLAVSHPEGNASIPLNMTVSTE